MGRVFLLLFASVWSAGILFFDGMAGHSLWRQFKSSHYPYVMGEVTSSKVTSSRDSKGRTRYSAAILYRYVVGNQTFTGSRVRYPMTLSQGHNRAVVIVKAHPAGSQTAVYFNPRDPEDAVLSPDLDGSDLMILLFLMPFNIIVAGFWTAIGAWMRQKILKPVAGGVKIIVRGPQTRIRLPEYSALVWAIVTVGVLSFVSLFIVGAASSFSPSILTASLTLLFVIGAGAGVYFWYWCKIHSGDDDLILDETSTTIALPETFGRKQRVTVKRSEIERLLVEEVAIRSSKGGVYYTYAPTLWVRRNGIIETEKLADLVDQKKAEAFVEWLRGRLNLTEAPADK